MDYSSIMKELLNPSSKPNRSGKDLSHRKVFTAKAGELLPILCEEMVPNDYFEIDTATLVRSFPLQTAAFLRARVHYDFFFVPKTALWRNWNRFYYQRDDRQTALMNGFAYEPNLTLQDIVHLINCNPGSVLDSADSRCKIVQLLGYGNYRGLAEADFASGGQYAAIGQKSLTALPLVGYNRIYNMWYRNAWRDEPNAIAAQTYSLDRWDCTSYSTSLGNSNIPVGTGNVEDYFLNMHYHGWFSDLFMSSLPSQQFGAVSTIDMSNPVKLTNPSSFPSTTVQGSFNKSADDLVVAEYGNFASTNQTLKVDSSFDVLALRKALALQKWKEYNMRAGWKNKNQARAMFGVSTPDDRPHDVEFLKGYDFPFMIDEVVSQNGATGGNLADLAGKGIGVGNGEKLTFNSGERHGYLYCIAYIMPQAEYDANMIDKSLVRSEPFDHYVPAFENLGMEPIQKFELNARGNSAVFDSVLGYAPRYHEYKQRFDKVYGEFMIGNTLASWVSVRRDLAGIANSGVIPTQYFYVNPSCLDTIFAASATGSQQTDQFMLNVNFNFKAVRPMSDLGLPTL